MCIRDRLAALVAGLRGLAGEPPPPSSQPLVKQQRQQLVKSLERAEAVSYTHLRAHETSAHL
eukprot:7551201-Alexandrium_andersonii.AAC.1